MRIIAPIIWVTLGVGVWTLWVLRRVALTEQVRHGVTALFDLYRMLAFVSLGWVVTWISLLLDPHTLSTPLAADGLFFIDRATVVLFTVAQVGIALFVALRRRASKDGTDG